MASINQTGAGIRLPNFCNLGRDAAGAGHREPLRAGRRGDARRARSPTSAGSCWSARRCAEPVLIVSLTLLCAAPPGPARAALRRGAGRRRRPRARARVGLGAGLRRDVPGPGAGVLRPAGLLRPLRDRRHARLLRPARPGAVAGDRRGAHRRRCRRASGRTSSTTASTPSSRSSAPSRSGPSARSRTWPTSSACSWPTTGRSRPSPRRSSIARQYLAIEELRLGERLRVTWRVDDDARRRARPARCSCSRWSRTPSTTASSPREGGGEIAIEVTATGERARHPAHQPLPAAGDHHAGNQMALANIRERLQLHFDAEASMQLARGRRHLRSDDPAALHHRPR